MRCTYTVNTIRTLRLAVKYLMPSENNVCHHGDYCDNSISSFFSSNDTLMNLD